MNLLRTILVSVTLLVWANASLAQDTPHLESLQPKVEEARAAVKAAAQEIKAELVALVPSAPGWKCRESDRSPTTDVFELIPSVLLHCVHEEQSLDAHLIVDPSTSALFCRAIASDQQGIEEGRIKPKLFRFFEGGAWQVKRAGVSLQGCASEVLAFSADGNRSEASIANGPASIDIFAQALLSSRPEEVVAQAPKHANAINELMELLDDQSLRFAKMIETSLSADVEIVRPADALRMGMNLPMVLGFSPSASATLEIDGCRLIVEISASPVGLHEAKNTGRRWASPRSADGTVRGAFVTRNTERLKGLASQSGTSIEVLVDDLVLVRVVTPGGRICARDPDIVRRTFEEILARNPSSVVTP